MQSTPLHTCMLTYNMQIKVITIYPFGCTVFTDDLTYFIASMQYYGGKCHYQEYANETKVAYSIMLRTHD